MAVGEVGRARTLPRSFPAIAIPLLFLLTGTALRYLAWSGGGDAVGQGFAVAFCRWDCIWYSEIVEGGYNVFPVSGEKNVGNWAFFPLSPLLMRGASAFVPLPLPLLGLIVSSALSIGSCLVAWRLLDRDVPGYAVFCCYMLAGPFSFYFNTFLSEPLFVLLTLLVLAALRRGAYLQAGALVALLSATRIVGVFMVVAMIWRMFADHREAGGPAMAFPRQLLARPDLLVAIFVAPLGLFAFMLYLHLHMGDGFAFAHVQRSWARVTAWPWQHLWNALSGYGSQSWWPLPLQVNAVAALGGLAVGAWLVLRRDVAVGLFALVSVALPLAAGVASQVRFVATMLPMAVAASGPSRLSPVGAAILIALMHFAAYFTTIAWLGDSFALI
jgi:hypothetical protein